ncbi:phosphopantetheine-binding protein [Bacillus paralicheniformis]|nr:ketoacyl-synthetase C-terminal extension domain-containing protein [Bacillus paralicheniformis]UWS63433.1 phosphopantetheine-binding protein [Bacillus paralicheniformis]
MTKSFGKQTTETQFCSVGSVKSNIGHLESASGIAALTKVLLQMENHQLVPSIHSENLNPNINFKKTPFYIQQKLEYWDEPVIVKDGKETKVPRRAGISSFGAGGANAHVIVEEYKSLHGSPPVSEHTPMLFVLSARNEERLREYAKLLIEYLHKKNGIQQTKQSGTSDENVIFDDIQNKITCISANILGIKESNIDAEIELDEYGFDFVQSMRLKKEIEKELEIYLPDSVFNLSSSIHSIAGYIIELLSEDTEYAVSGLRG